MQIVVESRSTVKLQYQKCQLVYFLTAHFGKLLLVIKFLNSAYLVWLYLAPKVYPNQATSKQQSNETGGKGIGGKNRHYDENSTQVKHTACQGVSMTFVGAPSFAVRVVKLLLILISIYYRRHYNIVYHLQFVDEKILYKKL